MAVTCRGCIYAGYLGSDICCDYLLIRGKMRPCQGGAECTVKQCQKGKSGAAARVRHTWDTEKAFALYQAGKLDAEIAEAVGVAQSTVSAWRKREKLQSNKSRMAGGRRADNPLLSDGCAFGKR